MLEQVLLGILAEEVHQLRTERILDGLVAAMDGGDVDIRGRDDDDNVLAGGVDMQMQLGAHELGDVDGGIDAVVGQMDMDRTDADDDLAGDVCHGLEGFLLVGPSGCGKSTTLRMVAGLEEITEGELYIDGKLMNDVAPKDRDIAMVFQNYALYPHMTVYDNMAFSLKLKKVPKAEIDRKVKEAAEILDITQYLNRKPKALSGGQRQRVAIGRAIVRSPKVFLMDEPLSNLDAKLRNQMRAEIIKLREKIDTTFIYVTHDQVEAMTLGDRIVIMRDGFIQQIGTPQEVFNHPKNLFVAGFIGTPQMNFFPDAKLTVKDGKYVVELLGKSIVLPEDKQAALRARKQPEGTVTVGVRPVHLSLHQEGFPATIDVSEMMGSEMHLHMTVSGHDVIAVIPTAGLSLDDVRAGGTAHFTFDPELMHLFDPKTEENLFPVEDSKAKV